MKQVKIFSRYGDADRLSEVINHFLETCPNMIDIKFSTNLITSDGCTSYRYSAMVIYETEEKKEEEGVQ